MIVKVSLTVAPVVSLVLLGLAWREVGTTAASSERPNCRPSNSQPNLGCIEHAMLQGDGIVVKELVARFKERVPRAEIRVFDRRGAEVFGEPAALPHELPPTLAAVLAGGARTTTPDGHVLRPLVWDARCAPCHARSRVRGVIGLRPAGALDSAGREDVLGRLVSAGFVQMMTARRQKMLNAYLTEVTAHAPTLEKIGIYDHDGALAFGKAVPGVDRVLLRRQLARGSVPLSLATPPTGATLRLVPLPREDRCAACHQDHAPVRGVLAISLRDLPNTADAATEEDRVRYRRQHPDDHALQPGPDNHHLPRRGRGDRCRRGSTTLGRRRPQLLSGRRQGGAFLPAPSAGIDSADHSLLGSKPSRAGGGGAVAGQPSRVGICHGEASPVRGAVAVSLSTAAAAEARAAARRRPGRFIVVGAILYLLGVLFFLLQSPGHPSHRRDRRRRGAGRTGQTGRLGHTGAPHRG